ncbi:MAG: hypothetical protein NVSMB25_12720 [Thermoleophilaceae bacterium]
MDRAGDATSDRRESRFAVRGSQAVAATTGKRAQGVGGSWLPILGKGPTSGSPITVTALT